MIGKFTRRAFLASALVFGSSLLDPVIHLLPGQRLNEKALLWDVQVGAFRDQVSANEHAQQVREKLASFDAELDRHVLIESLGNSYAVMLDTNSPAQHIGPIMQELKEEGAIPDDSFVKQRDYFFNDRSTNGRFAYLVVEESLGDLVKKYTTAYGREVPTTVRSLNRLHQSRLGHGARKNDIVPVPVRFLKLPYQLGMEEGKDYATIELKQGNTLYSVLAEHTQGNLEANLAALMRFNEIKRGQEGELQAGTYIMIPNQIVGNPLEPTAVTINDSLEARITRSKPKSAPQKKLDQELRQAVRPTGQELDVIVNSQNLGVLKQTNMPAVLTESFNIKNFGQRRFYNDDENLRELAVAYAKGVVAYKQKHMPTLKTAIIDHGHGDKDSGTVHEESGAEERIYTRKIQTFLAQELEKRGIKAVKLNYSGKPSAKARINYYAREANKIGGFKDSVYIATHIDSMSPSTQPLPRGFVHSRGRQTYSTKLAQEMLKFAVPWYQANYR